jgi:hypothetical protein
MYISSRDCHSFSYDTWILRNPAPPGPAALAAAIIARGLHAVSCATPPARPGSAGGHGRGHHARATCRILRDPAQAGQPELAPAAIARGLRAVLGAGAAVAGATAPLYALPVGLLYAAAVLTLVEVGLHVFRRRTTALGAYAPRGSGGGGAVPPDRVGRRAGVGGGPRPGPTGPRGAPGWRVLPAAAIAKWRYTSVGDTHRGIAATFVAATPAATLSGEPVGRQI